MAQLEHQAERFVYLVISGYKLNVLFMYVQHVCMFVCIYVVCMYVILKILFTLTSSLSTVVFLFFNSNLSLKFAGFKRGTFIYRCNFFCVVLGKQNYTCSMIDSCRDAILFSVKQKLIRLSI